MNLFSGTASGRDSDLADSLPFLFEGVVGRNDHVGAVCGDIHVRRFAERDNFIRNAILLGIGFTLFGERLFPEIPGKVPVASGTSQLNGIVE